MSFFKSDSKPKAEPLEGSPSLGDLIEEARKETPLLKQDIINKASADSVSIVLTEEPKTPNIPNLDEALEKAKQIIAKTKKPLTASEVDDVILESSNLLTEIEHLEREKIPEIEETLKSDPFSEFSPDFSEEDERLMRGSEFDLALESKLVPVEVREILKELEKIWSENPLKRKEITGQIKIIKKSCLEEIKKDPEKSKIFEIALTEEEKRLEGKIAEKLQGNLDEYWSLKEMQLENLQRELQSKKDILKNLKNKLEGLMDKLDFPGLEDVLVEVERERLKTSEKIKNQEKKNIENELSRMRSGIDSLNSGIRNSENSIVAILENTLSQDEIAKLLCFNSGVNFDFQEQFFGGKMVGNFLIPPRYNEPEIVSIREALAEAMPFADQKTLKKLIPSIFKDQSEISDQAEREKIIGFKRRFNFFRKDFLGEKAEILEMIDSSNTTGEQKTKLIETLEKLEAQKDLILKKSKFLQAIFDVQFIKTQSGKTIVKSGFLQDVNSLLGMTQEEINKEREKIIKRIEERESRIREREEKAQQIEVSIKEKIKELTDAGAFKIENLDNSTVFVLFDLHHQKGRNGQPDKDGLMIKELWKITKGKLPERILKDDESKIRVGLFIMDEDNIPKSMKNFDFAATLNSLKK